MIIAAKFDDEKNISKKGLSWAVFSMEVFEHIEKYVVPQYGDKGDDLCTTYSIEECLKQAKKYIERYGKNAREGQQKLDFLKAAHFIQMAFEKWLSEPTSEPLEEPSECKQEIYVSAARIEDSMPCAYRLYSDPWNNLHLQGCFKWSCGTSGGIEWKIIPTVTDKDEGNNQHE